MQKWLVSCLYRPDVLGYIVPQDAVLPLRKQMNAQADA